MQSIFSSAVNDRIGIEPDEAQSAAAVAGR
jgi:hypothetical protein